MGVLAISIVLIAIHIHKMRASEHYSTYPLADLNFYSTDDNVLLTSSGPVQYYQELIDMNPEIKLGKGQMPFVGPAMLN
jgi:hypothetical protein